MEAFSHIYIEERLLGSGRALQILSHFPNAAVIPIGHYKDVFNRHGQDIALQHRYQNLILAEKHGKLVYPGAPVCQSFGNRHFYYTSCAVNCFFDCEYCYLKGMYPSGNLLLFLNIEEIFQELRVLLRAHPVYLSVSYDTDLLALHEIFPYARLWAELVKTEPGLTVELRTKSGALSYWKELRAVFGETGDGRERLITAFTLSPEYIIREYEHRTGTLWTRLRSARAGLALGMPVRLCFDPMIYCPDWRAQYEALLREVFRALPTEQLRDVSIGSFRISESYLRNMRRAFPRSAVVQYPYENDHGVCHYSAALTEEMEGFLFGLLRERLPEERIFRWRE